MTEELNHGPRDPKSGRLRDRITQPQPPAGGNNPHDAPVSIREAATRIGISPFGLRRLLRRRKLAYYKVGRRVVLDPADIEAFRRTTRIEPRTERP
jgi:excisionase family DNA binding protein